MLLLVLLLLLVGFGAALAQENGTKSGEFNWKAPATMQRIEGIYTESLGEIGVLGSTGPESRFGVIPQENYVYGFFWEPEVDIIVTVGDDETSTTSDDGGYFHIPRGEISFEAGDTVTVYDGKKTKTHLVTELELDEVDRDQNTVTGTAKAGTEVTVGVSDWVEQIIHDEVEVDADGIWELDFSAEYGYEIHEGTWVFAWQLDDTGDRTYNYDPPASYFNVYPQYGIIVGQFWSVEDDENIRVTINDENDNEVASFVINSDEMGHFYSWDNVVDIEPGYTVIVSDDAAGIEKIHTVTSLSITDLNRADKTVSGSGDDDYPTEVRVVDDQGNSAYLEVPVSGGSWDADFSGKNVNFYGNIFIEAWQADEDRDTTADDKYIPFPIFTVDPTTATIAVHNWPVNTELDITVEDPAGPSWSGSVVTDENGDYWLSIEHEFTIDTGHTVTVTDGVTTKFHVVTALRIHEVDWENNTISGVAEPGTDVEVRIYDNPNPVRIETADGNGNWTADFSTAVGDEPRDSAYDIRPGNTGNANQRDDEGDETHIYWQLNTFGDVPADHPFFYEIEMLVASEITTGYDDGTFRPNANVTRMAMAAFLYRGLELEDADVEKPTFSDVPIDHPFFTEIEALAASGITTGYDDGTFRPSANVTRQAMAAFLVRGLDLEEDYDVPAEPTFSDVSLDHPFITEIELLAASGITTGYDDGTFRPSDNVTRMAMSAFLVRGLELED